MRGTNRTRGLRRLLAVAGAALMVVSGIAMGGAAHALPPGGPGPETPGTSSRVWPTTVKPGDKLNFEVKGYPANETLNIKIDDGTACSDTSHGACVYAQVKIGSNGVATGSITVPELANGGHWLRMLATGPVIDKKTGKVRPNVYQGYTRRGGNDFTVTGSSASDNSAGAGAINAPALDAAGSDLSGSGGNAGGESESVDAGELDIDIDEEEEAQVVEEEEGASVEAGAAAETQQAAEGPAETGSSIPVIGIAVLGGALVLGGAGVAWALVRRRKLMAAAAAGAAAPAASDSASAEPQPEPAAAGAAPSE